jgi:hypothetical protein
MERNKSRQNQCNNAAGSKKARVVSKGLIMRKQVAPCHTQIKIRAVIVIL